MHKRRQGSQWNRIRPIVLAVAALGAGGNAAAFNIDTGNEDVEMRWDNTVRYNVGARTKGRSDLIGNNLQSDEGTYSFDRGDIVTNRFDLLTEFDVSYKKMVGGRISAAGWYDAAYGDDSRANPRIASLASYNNTKYSNYTKRYYAGPSGELLDAFVFANVDLGNVPTKVRAGRHTVFWGESLFLSGALHGISYAQMPLDLQKGFATPGVEAKELFRPLNQVSGQVQVTDTLSLAGQYFLEWESYRYPEGGTYLGPGDMLFNGPDSYRVTQLPNLNALGPYKGQFIGYKNGGAIKPDQNGEFGLSARWSPEALDGTLGFYYRRYTDKVPQILVTKETKTPKNPALGAASNVPLLNGSQYNFLYADNVDLFGISLAKNIGGLSVGVELSYRHNTPLAARLLGVPVAGASMPEGGETTGPRGDTMHGLINVLGIVPKTMLFDSASWATELVWSRLQKVSSGADLFQGVGYGGCPSGDWHFNCATRDYFGLGASFAPTWYQVMAGVDLSAPVTVSYGLSGNAATTLGGNQGTGNYSLGLGFDIFQKHRIDLKYVSYFGRLNDTAYNPATGLHTVTPNGLSALLKDRDFLGLTFKTTF